MIRLIWRLLWVERARVFSSVLPSFSILQAFRSLRVCCCRVWVQVFRIDCERVGSILSPTKTCSFVGTTPKNNEGVAFPRSTVVVLFQLVLTTELFAIYSSPGLHTGIGAGRILGAKGANFSKPTREFQKRSKPLQRGLEKLGERSICLQMA